MAEKEIPVVRGQRICRGCGKVCVGLAWRTKSGKWRTYFCSMRGIGKHNGWFPDYIDYSYHERVNVIYKRVLHGG